MSRKNRYRVTIVPGGAKEIIFDISEDVSDSNRYPTISELCRVIHMELRASFFDVEVVPMGGGESLILRKKRIS